MNPNTSRVSIFQNICPFPDASAAPAPAPRRAQPILSQPFTARYRSPARACKTALLVVHLSILTLLPACHKNPAPQNDWRWKHKSTREYILLALEAEHADTRRAALLAVAERRSVTSPESFDALVCISRTDTSTAVRRAAVAALARYTDERPVAPLLALLSPTPGPRTHDHAITPSRASAESGDALTATRPIDDALRCDVLRALRTLAARAAIPLDAQPAVRSVLIDHLAPARSHQVRIEAAQALQYFYARDAITALIAALADRDFGVVFHSRESLRALSGIRTDMTPSDWRTWLDGLDFPAARAGS